MGLELRQSLKLTQQLVMTPQLQQAIKLLQLSRMELVEAIQQELLENPMLEVQEEPVEEPQARNDERRRELGADEADLIRSADWESYLGDFSSMAKQAQVREVEVLDEVLSYEGRLSSAPSLQGHLLWQLCLSDLDAEARRAGEEIIGNLDSSGYLSSSDEELAEAAGVSKEIVEQVVHFIQRMDPVGVASRSLQECLAVQLEIIGEQDPILYSLVWDHLEDIEKRRFKPLIRKFHMAMEDMKVYLEIIQKLDPMPGARFGGDSPRYISPDAYVFKYEDDFVIVLNDDGLPKLQLNPFFMDGLSKRSGKDAEYLTEKIRSAQWLMKSLHQRQRTLYKVLESIVRFQRGFFEEGVSQLRPLILKDVAEDIEMHESTVSRITSNKYVATPHGLCELKFFFNSALDMDDGSQVGSESVKAAIKGMIADENPKKPLSDDRIVQLLKERLDVNIARRTVAKYRAALNIPSSSKRRAIF
ncbi:MAG: RNA polymerase sigma-54 factor [Deltaproteobacteria bacterium]|nr:RNA polymerase sigma-54 factor [Deltaproteobacteria bacterium]